MQADYDGPVSRDEDQIVLVQPTSYESAYQEWKRLLRAGDLVCGENCPLNDIDKCTGRCY